VPTSPITCDAAALRAARTHAGHSRAALAAAVGVTTSTLGAWETGRSQPTLERLARTAQALHVPIDTLIHTTELPPTLLALRISKGINQATLAARVGISRSYMSQIERGEAPLHPNLEQQLAKALGVARRVIRERYASTRAALCAELDD
jgi:transcriptional regulator with XRE-family HTH domain